MKTERTLEMFEKRRTVRKFKDRKVPVALIEKIITAASLAPSAHNMQPWKFMVFSERRDIENVAGVVDRVADDIFSGFNAVMRESARNIGESPHIVLVYRTGEIQNRFGKFGEEYSKLAEVAEIQSVATAIENMLLCSSALGLGMGWYGISLLAASEINDLVKEDKPLQAVLSLGYPKESTEPTGRKRLNEIVEYF